MGCRPPSSLLHVDSKATRLLPLPSHEKAYSDQAPAVAAGSHDSIIRVCTEVNKVVKLLAYTLLVRWVRRLGVAVVDMSHVALGIVEAYWEYRLKPWDMAAGVLIVEEAGGTVTCMDEEKFSVFDRSALISNGIVREKLLHRIGPVTVDLKYKGIDFSKWFKPESYATYI